MSKKTRRFFIHLAVSIGISAGLFFLIYFLNPSKTLSAVSDGLFVAAMANLGWTGLVFVTRQGSFDVLSYGIGRFIDQWRHKDKKQYDNAGDYQLAMKDKRSKKSFPYLAYLLVGASLLIAAIIVTAVFVSSVR